MPIDFMGMVVGLIGVLSLGAVTNYTLAVRKLRKGFVWETLKNG